MTVPPSSNIPQSGALHCRNLDNFHGVNWMIPQRISVTPESSGVIELNQSMRIVSIAYHTPAAYTTAPMTIQTKKKPTAAQRASISKRPVNFRMFNSIGRADGSIIATIMTSHISKNIIADPVHVYPGMAIHIMDIFQPPGISMPPAMESQK
jgi:N-acetylglucosamine-6-phosphate deacetylase